MPNENRCRHCNRIMLGITACSCQDNYDNQKLWDTKLRKQERKKNKEL